MLSNRRGNTVDLNEVAHDEPPHQDLRCLQIQLFLSLVVKAFLLLNIHAGSTGTQALKFGFLSEENHLLKPDKGD